MSKQPILNRNNKQNQVVQNSQTLTHYQGPIPPPDLLQGLDDLVPGTAAQLIKLAIDESEHRRALELKATEANIAAQQQQSALSLQQSKSVFRSDLIGQIFGLIVCLLSISGAVFLGLEDHEWLAVSIAAIPTAAIIKAFARKK